MLPFIISPVIAFCVKRKNLGGHWLIGSLIFCFLTYSTLHETVYKQTRDWDKQPDGAVLLLGFAVTVVEVGRFYPFIEPV